MYLIGYGKLGCHDHARSITCDIDQRTDTDITMHGKARRPNGEAGTRLGGIHAIPGRNGLSSGNLEAFVLTTEYDEVLTHHDDGRSSTKNWYPGSIIPPPPGQPKGLAAFSPPCHARLVASCSKNLNGKEERHPRLHCLCPRLHRYFVRHAGRVESLSTCDMGFRSKRRSVRGTFTMSL